MTGRAKNNRGFTLIEIITVIVVLGILSVFTFSFIDNAVKTYMIGSKQRMLYQEASYAMERITRELRDANSALILDAGSDNSSLSLSSQTRPAKMDNNPTIQFQRSGNTIVRTGTGSQVLGNNVTQFKVDVDPAHCFPFSVSSWYLCSGADPKGILSITLSVTDQDIPISDASAKTVTITTKISPKNYQPGIYTGRSFNGDYYDVIQ